MTERRDALIAHITADRQVSASLRRALESAPEAELAALAAKLREAAAEDRFEWAAGDVRPVKRGA